MALRHTAECDPGVKIIMGTAVNSGASLWCLGGGGHPKLLCHTIYARMTTLRKQGRHEMEALCRDGTQHLRSASLGLCHELWLDPSQTFPA